MRKSRWGFVLVFMIVPVMGAKPPESGPATAPPPWAYGFNATTGAPAADTPDSQARGGKDDGTLQHVPGSALSFTLTQLRNIWGPADWFPNDHPPMPEVVAHGNKPDVRACSFCHYPNGKGRPVNTNLTGLPYNYILHALAEFRNGERTSADDRKGNTRVMIGFAKAMSDDEMEAAARYFSSIKWTAWIRVVETDMVPKTRIANGIFLRVHGDEKEPIGERIIETPENVELMEVLRDDRSGFIAYVPVGSVKKGEALVRTGGGKTIQCATCHGSDLMGMEQSSTNGNSISVPGLAGRSPSYIARQLYDMQHGFRHGEWTDQMKPVVANLSGDDMLAIAAYLASRPVQPAPTATAQK